jgi:hypothetical protein
MEKGIGESSTRGGGGRKGGGRALLINKMVPSKGQSNVASEVRIAKVFNENLWKIPCCRYP